jgi:glucose/arabinose dehydrogenase
MTTRKFGALFLLIGLLAGCSLRGGTGSSTPRSLSATKPAPTTVPLPANSSPAKAQGPAVPVPINLPPGFAATLYAQDLGKPRGIAVGPDGAIVVGDTKNGRVLDITKTGGAGLATPAVVAQGFVEPHSVTFHAGKLYVGDRDKVVRLERGANGAWGNQQTIIPNVPSTGDHTTRTVLFGQDGKLYLSIGSTCNVCKEEDERRAAVMQFNADGSNGRVYARGLRNAVGMTLRPGTSQIWVSNNGRDMLGDNLPPETVYVLRDGGDYGWPRCHSGRIVDPEYGNAQACSGVIAPVVEMQAHSAPLGLTFYTGRQFPAEYRGNLFVAFHGSWNRSAPTGYKVVRVPVDANGQAGPVQDFATGWLASGNDVAGRPVDVVTAPDGSLLVTDDRGGRVYRISYVGS